MDRLLTMKTFVAVAEEAGFAPAARRLGMSAPSVTRAISELEDRLGCRLLHRTTRLVRLTDAGVRYLTDCRRIMAEVEEAERQARGDHAAPRGMVSVTASVMFGRVVLRPILTDLLDRYPEMRVSALFVDRVVHLLDEGIDVGVRIAELPDSSLMATRVGSVRRVLCASPDYLAEHGRPRRPSDLSDYDTISFAHFAPGGEWDFREKGRRSIHKPRSRFLVNTADTAIEAAAAGSGITRVLSYMIAPQVQTGELEIVLDTYEPPPVPVHVIHKERGDTSARVRAVVDHLVHHLRCHAALAE